MKPPKAIPPKLEKKIKAEIVDTAMASEYRNKALMVEIKDPQKAYDALQLKAAGATWDELDVHLPGMSRTTMSRLFREHAPSIAEMRKVLAPEMMQTAGMYLELMNKKAAMLSHDEEALSKVSPDKLAIAMGIVADKGLLMEGEATVIHEHKKGASLEDAKAAISAARARLAKGRVIDAETC